MEKILLDTDIGCDIDDAICLAYLLAHPQCELMGITTVNGDTCERAKLASALCIAAGMKDIPIYPGAQDTLLVRRLRKPVLHAQALSHLAHCETFASNSYLDFLKDTILSHPNEITLLCIGPMTNAGLLFAAYPDTARALKRLVLMGGNFENPLVGLGYMESNTMCDPHASELVYRAAAPVHRSIGCDVTNGVSMPREEVYKRFSHHAILSAVLPMADVYFSHGAKELFFHDSCAAATIFNDAIAQWRSGLVEVELRADALMGMTVCKHAAYMGGHHQIACSVDRQAYLDDFRAVFGV
jgi:purine nucleosidase